MVVNLGYPQHGANNVGKQMNVEVYASKADKLADFRQVNTVSASYCCNFCSTVVMCVCNNADK